MKKRKYHRVGITAAQSAELWERWKAGEDLHAIARALGKWHSAIASHLAPSGGMRPAERRRSARALSLAEREEISRGVVAGRSIRAIGAALGRAPSTIKPTRTACSIQGPYVRLH